MASVALQVNTSTDDARNNSGNGTFNATVVSQTLGLNAGVDYWNGFRFTNVTIPQGATINSASLDVYSNGVSAGTSALAILYGEAADNAVTFANTTAGKPEGRTRTTASVSLNLDPSVWNTNTGFGLNLISVTTLVQEIVNRGGWASGNALAIVGHDNGSVNGNYVAFSTYDFSGNARGPKLTIDYTASGGGGTVTSSATALLMGI